MNTRSIVTLKRVGVLLAAASLFLVASCGDDDSSSSSSSSASAGGINVDQAKTNVTAAQAAPTAFEDPGPAFDAAKVSGKKVYYISYSEQSPALVVWSKTMKGALESYGADVTVFDGKGQQTEFQRGMQQAINAKADVILLMGIDPASISAEVKDAESAGIPVIVGSNGETGIPDTPGVVASVTLDHETVGKYLASWMVADAGKPFHSLIVTHPGVLGLDPLVGSVKSNLESLCSECQLKVESVPFTKLATLPQIAQTAVQKDPELEYMLSVYDFELLSLLTGVTQANATDQVSLGSFNATEAVMKELAKGSAIKADVGNPNEWFGYALADQIMRVATGTEPVADELVPLRLFTPDNIGDIDIAAGENTWYGDVDFQAGYQKLWGEPTS